MKRIALVPSEPIRDRMAGIGIRYLELARRLPRKDFEVVLLTAGDPAEVPQGLDGVTVRAFERGALVTLLEGCDAVLTQGQLANDVLLEVPHLPVAVDFYDPFLVENFAYFESLGLDPFRNDHATWVLQLSRGDFFLCSSEEQRQYYLGFLTALGRVNPLRVKDDPDLRSLVDVVPFGAPEDLPPHLPLLEPREPGERRLLFGGLYDWYDPWPVLGALERLDDPNLRLLFIRNPNPEGTPQALFRRVEAWCVERGYWGERVQVLDWVSAERRFDLLRDVDVLVATHGPSLETRLSLRTRFLEALAADCPVITSEGGAMSRLLREHRAGAVVPFGDSAAVAEALAGILGASTEEMERRRAAQQTLLEEFRWSKALAPLVAFCRDPQRDVHKGEFAHKPAVEAPPDALSFRLRRFLRRRFGGGR